MGGDKRCGVELDFYRGKKQAVRVIESVGFPGNSSGKSQASCFGSTSVFCLSSLALLQHHHHVTG